MHTFLFPIGTEIESIKVPWVENYKVVGAFYNRATGEAFYQLQLAEHEHDGLLELPADHIERLYRFATLPLGRFDSSDRVIAAFEGTPQFLGWVKFGWGALVHCIDLTTGETEVLRPFTKHVKGWTFTKVKS